MSKELFWAFFLFVCAPSIFGKNPDLSQPVPDQEQQIDRMFDLTNRIRAERRLPILGLDARLCNAAAVHAEEMARYNYVSDRGHGIFGSNPGSRAWACGYAWSSIAETVCAGSSDVRSVLTSWLRSRAHAHILMDPQYQDAGIGLAHGATRTYWVLMLATKPSNSSPLRDWNSAR
ncbi:MAG TPA: CAP domain-containing protein [Chthoniobacterales bacterium]|nr:CAP domain-containing protein [Chthoniobacterales bacterium]